MTLNVAEGLWAMGEVFTFREGEMWIAAWRRYEVVSQGTEERIALQRLYMQIAGKALSDAAEGKVPFVDVPVPSDALLTRWAEGHALAHSSPGNKVHDG